MQIRLASIFFFFFFFFFCLFLSLIWTKIVLTRIFLQVRVALWSSRLIALDCHEKEEEEEDQSLSLLPPFFSVSSFGSFAPEECERLPTHHRQDQVGDHPLRMKRRPEPASRPSISVYVEIFIMVTSSRLVYILSVFPVPPTVFRFLPEKWPHRSRIGTWKWEKRRRLFGGNRKKKKYIFLAKEIADKTWNNSGFSPFYPTIPPSASYFCFMDLAVIVGLHTKVWFISIRLSLLF